MALQEALYTSRNPTRRWLHCTRRERIEAALGGVADATGRGRALEIGPGSGVYLPLLVELFDDVVVTDIEETFLDSARSYAASAPNLSVVTDDVTATQLPEKSFDAVLCSEVVEHIADSPAALRGIRRLLRPGGYLVLSTPQRHSPLEIASRVAFLPGVISVVRSVYREPILPTGHINLLTPAQARAQLEAAGFEILQSDQSGVYLPGIAELTGNVGLRFERWLEGKARRRLRRLLWTQYYVARA